VRLASRSPDLGGEWIYLTTGAWQHVFVPPGNEFANWVCKIPAAFGDIVPYHHGITFWVRNPYERALNFVCYALPRGLQNRICRRIEKLVERYRPAGGNVALPRFQHLAQRLGALGERRLVGHCRRMRARNFEGMLSLIERISDRGIDGVLVPCRVIRAGEARLRVDGATRVYRGPILLQQRADRLLENECDLESFEWNELVEAPHRLWRHGIGLASPPTLGRAVGFSPAGRIESWFRKLRSVPEILGPSGWVQLNGRVLLADTSSLTRDYTAVRLALRDDGLNVQQQRILDRLRLRQSPIAAEYYEFVRRRINQEHLDRLWGTARPGRPVSAAVRLRHAPPQ